MKPATIAAAAHAANRVLQSALGEPVSPAWEEEALEIRESVLSGVLGALAGVTPQESHEAWLRFKRERGWKYGPRKDLDLKEHPNLLPYDELPPEQQVKDKLFLAIVDALKD